MDARYQREAEAQELADRISRFVNHGGDGTALANALLRDHRTLQQAFVSRVLVPYLVGLAVEGTDLRNQAAVDLAKTLVAAGQLGRVGSTRGLPFW